MLVLFSTKCDIFHLKFIDSNMNFLVFCVSFNRKLYLFMQNHMYDNQSQKSNVQKTKSIVKNVYIILQHISIIIHLLHLFLFFTLRNKYFNRVPPKYHRFFPLFPYSVSWRCYYATHILFIYVFIYTVIPSNITNDCTTKSSTVSIFMSRQFRLPTINSMVYNTTKKQQHVKQAF